MGNSELDQQLLYECMKDNIDFSKIDELLKQGANPLAKFDDEAILESILSRYQDTSEDAKRQYQILELFFENGMNLEDGEPYKDETGDDYGPLEPMRFNLNKEIFDVVKLLNKYNVQHKYIESYIIWLISDKYYVDEYEGHEEEFENAFLILMLVCSFSGFLDNNDGMKSWISYNSNTYEISKFYNIENYYCKIDYDPKTPFDGIRNSKVKIYDKKNDEVVWIIDN